MTRAGAAPTFSLVIPARNAARFIEATLASVAGQTNGDFEAIVLDDGSTDDTAARVDAFVLTDASERFILRQGPSRGVSAARNLGLEMARGAIIVFLDADDLLAPDALERFAGTLADSPAVAALGGIARIAEDGAGVSSADNRDLVPAEGQLEALIRKNYIVNGGALAIRTDAARTAGGYSEDLRYGEDWEFWCRLLLEGDLAVVTGPRLLSYRQVSSGANNLARGSDFARRVPCLVALAENPRMRARFGPRLDALLKDRQIDIFWSGVRSTYQYGAKVRALSVALAGLFVYPSSLARPAMALRLLRSMKG
jgi:glycosyltransferase involved in cell wall biosynthesis